MIWPSNHSIYTAHSAHSYDHQHITKYTQRITMATNTLQSTLSIQPNMLPTHKLSPLRVQLCLPATCPAQSDNWVKYGVRGSDGQEVMKSILISTYLVWFSNKGWMGKLWKGWMW